MTRDKTDDVAARNTNARFSLRFASSMRDRIAEQARENSRTMNAEIIAQLLKVEQLELEVARLSFIVEEIRDAKVAQEATNG